MNSNSQFWGETDKSVRSSGSIGTEVLHVHAGMSYQSLLVSKFSLEVDPLEICPIKLRLVNIAINVYLKRFFKKSYSFRSNQLESFLTGFSQVLIASPLSHIS